MKPELNMSWVHSEELGYGRLGVKLNEALPAIGVDVHDGQPGPDYPDTKPCNVTMWVSTPSHARGWFKGQYPVMFTMFESSILPEAFREAFDNFEQLIVPSEHNVELFSQFHPNVKMVPLGVDPAEWYFIPRPPADRYFRFLIAGSGQRKGTDLAYEAFRKVFGHGMWTGSGPEPILVCKNPRGEDYWGDRIEMQTGKVPAAEEREIYAQAHCYLQPSRGEGFGLQPLQAMAQGIPTILTDAHGHKAFSHLGYGLSTTMSKSGYFIFGESGDWWEPNLDELCDHMRWIYDHYEEAALRAEINAEVVAREFTWTVTAEKLVDAIGLDHLTTPFDGDRQWVAPAQRKFLVRINRPWAADVCGIHHQWKPGQDYWELADVKRILFEGGLLDPSCLNPTDLGLLPSQVDHLEEYLSTRGFCQTCGQPLGEEMLTRAQLIAAELEEKAAQRAKENPPEQRADRRRPWLNGPSDPDIIWDRYHRYSGSVAFDIGANSGVVARILSRRFGRVVAFEPAMESFQALAGKVRSGVICMNAAVSDHCGELTLAVADRAVTLGELVDPEIRPMETWGRITDTRTVRCYTIDDAAAMFSDPSFIKIDTEGHELKIIQGGLDTLARCHPKLVIEVHDAFNGEEIVDLLSDYTFELVRHPAYKPDSMDWLSHFWLISKEE